MKFILVVTLISFLVGCGGGGGSAASTPSSNTGLSLQCDLTSKYTPRLAALSSAGTGTTTVIALHGKSGVPTLGHMSTLSTTLNAKGYNVIMPYMSWSTKVWDGSLCDGFSYVNELIVAEKAKGNAVVLLGHSLGGVNVVSYAALANTTKPDAVVAMAPGHFPHDSTTLANNHASSIQAAKAKVAAGLGDEIGTYQTSDYMITASATNYLTFHDTSQFPAIKTAISSNAVPTLWLAGLADPLTAIAKNLGIINVVSANSKFKYKEIAGNHYTLDSGVAAELDTWYTGL